MKAVGIATSALILLLGAIIINSIFIDKTTEKFADEISKIDTQDLTATAEKLKEIHREFKKAEKIISITVSHDDLTNIEESFADMIGAAEAKMETNVITAKSRLEDALRHLGRLSSINLDSII